MDTSTAGNYTRYYDVEDAAGNEAETVSRVVTVMGPPQTLLVEGPVGGDVLLTPGSRPRGGRYGQLQRRLRFWNRGVPAAVPATGYVFWEWSSDLYGTSQAVVR